MKRGDRSRGRSPRPKGEQVEEQNKITLTDAVGRDLLDFEIDGKKFFVRQPSPEEYDDADALKTLTYNRTLEQDYVKDVADMPCSTGERALFQMVLETTQEKFEHANGDDQMLKDSLSAEIVRLQGEIETRTLAQEFASDKATLTRDRWLTMRLLCNDTGKAVFNVRAKDFETQWTKFPIKVKDAARPVIWRALTLVREAPFL